MHFKTEPELYTSREIKREAKAQLEGNWVQAVLMALIPALFSFLFIRNTASSVMDDSLQNNFLSIIVDIISNFLVLGISFGFLNLLRSRDYTLEPIQEIASPFRSNYFANLFLMQILKYLYIFLWYFLLIIPGIIKGYAYSQAEFIYKDTVDRTGEQPNARAVLDESQRLMQGHKMDLFALDLSFIGWQFFSVLTLGLLNLWLTPYTAMSRAVFYENLTNGDYRNEIQETEHRETDDEREEIGKDPDDFRDFEDF